MTAQDLVTTLAEKFQARADECDLLREQNAKLVAALEALLDGWCGGCECKEAVCVHAKAQAVLDEENANR